MKRGQVAMEFIMTYGWAILVVLVAIGALAYFGVLNPAKFLPERCVFTTGVSCRDFQLSESGSDLIVKFNLENGMGNGLIIGKGNISTAYKDTVGTCDPDDGWSAGDTFTIGTDTPEMFTCTITGMSPGKGQLAKVSVGLNYTSTQGYYMKRLVGDIAGRVQ